MFKRIYSLDNSQQQWHDWREMLTYPQHVKSLTVRLLDTMAEMVPYPNEDDRYSAITDWLGEGFNQGLLTKKELINIRSELGQQI
jgi:hypothetical protein